MSTEETNGHLDHVTGCGFLEPGQIGPLVEGNLDGSLRRRFHDHIDQGCMECLQLSSAIELFRRVVEEGPAEVERRQFESTEPMLRERLGRELARRHGLTGFEGRCRGLSTSDLEWIAAAGPETPTGPGADEPEGDPETERDPDS